MMVCIRVLTRPKNLILKIETKTNPERQNSNYSVVNSCIKIEVILILYLNLTVP